MAYLCDPLYPHRTLNIYIAKQQAAFEIKVLRRMFGRIKINKNWSKRYDKELLQLFGDLDIITHIFQTKSG